jgi:hypothetical protein
MIPVRTSQTGVSQNVMLVAAKNKQALNLLSNNPEYTKYLSNIRYWDISADTRILTDDYAPVDSLISELIKP